MSGTLTEVGSNVARFEAFGPDLVPGLLIEGQRTNGLRNPRGGGAVVGVLGSGGALPTNWSVTMPTGITTAVHSVGSTNGVPWVELEFTGTSTAAGNPTIAFDATNAIAASNGDTWAMSAWLQVTQGVWPGAPNLRLGAFLYNSVPAFVGGALFTGNIGASLGTWQRFDGAAVLAVAGTAFIRPQLEANISLPIGTVFNCRLRIGAPQLELGAFVSSLILPPIGVPAAATRVADLLTAPWSALAPGGAATMLISARLRHAATDARGTLLSAHDGTAINRLSLRTFAGGLGIVRAVGGVAASQEGVLTGLGGTVQLRAGLTVATGRIAAFAAGGTLQALTGALPTVTTGQIGALAAGSDAMFGHVFHARVLNQAVDDTQLQALVNALPVITL